MPGGHPATPLASFSVQTLSAGGVEDVVEVGGGGGGSVEEYTGCGAVDGTVGRPTRAFVFGSPAGGSATATLVGTEAVTGGRTFTVSLAAGVGAGGRLFPLLR